MFSNYLKVAIRTLLRYKGSSLINIGGLAAGMAACILILSYTHYETSYDTFHSNSDRIYRLRHERIDENGGGVRFASCCPPAAPLIRDRFPEVEQIGRMIPRSAVVANGDIKFLEEKIFYAEPEALDVLKFNFLSGDPTVSLGEVNNAFISETISKKYFGSENPVGKSLLIDGKDSYKVAGIFQDIPSNSHIKFDILLSFVNIASYFGPEVMEAWGHTGFYTYLRLKPNTDLRKLNEKFAALVESEFGDVLKEYQLQLNLILQPLTSIHLNSHVMQELEANGSQETVNYLLIIALFIILIAWGNYINLTTARSVVRAREVGLRKAVGATRRQLVIQFLIDSLLANIIAIVLALFILEFTLPIFDRITGLPLESPFWKEGWFWAITLILFASSTLFAGILPALALSSFKPTTTLRGLRYGGRRNIFIRKSMVVVQFALAMGLIFSTIVAFRQINFMKHKDLGFNKDQLMVIKAPRVRDENFEHKVDTFKESIKQIAGIDNVCAATEVPGRQILWDAGAIFRAGADIGESRNFQIMGVDYDFVNTFGVEILFGRNFSEQFPSDEKALLMNETAVSWLGFNSPEDAVGEQVNYWGELFDVVGVVKDYHQQSPKIDFEPTLFRLVPYGRGKRMVFAAHIQTADVAPVIKQIQNRYKEFFPGNPFDFFFLDEYFNQQYRSDLVLSKVLGLFAGLAVILCCMGILGLSSHMILERTKEIGIRKALGANVSNVVLLLSGEWARVVFAANIIAWPFTYLVMTYWLQNFAYQTKLSLWIFVSAGLAAMSLVVLTVSFHVSKAANLNPAHSLRHE